MSVQIRAVIICDGGCGGKVHGEISTNTTYGMESYWNAKDEAAKSGWVVLHRHGKPKHFCPTCADRAIKEPDAAVGDQRGGTTQQENKKL